MTGSKQRVAEQTLRMLIDKLDELLLYIEPSVNGLQAYSHKTRELLILACTEVENVWKRYMIIANYDPDSTLNTNHYVKLHSPLYLSNYEIRLKTYDNIEPIRPFDGWSSDQPTKSLLWYGAYNQTKHDRSRHFSKATLKNCIHAIAANIVLFCVSFGPNPLLNGKSTLSALINQLFNFQLIEPDPKSFYAPKIQLPNTYSKELVCGRGDNFMQSWILKPLMP